MNRDTVHAGRAGLPIGWMAALLLVGLFGCGDSGSSGISQIQAPTTRNEVFGSAIENGSPEAGVAWRDAALAWPKQGNINLLFENPSVQARFAEWMRAEPGSLQSVPEVVLPSMEKLQAFNDRLISIDGAWGRLPDTEGVRPMAMRGLQPGLWFDLRHTATRGDVDRATDILVTMGTVPRVLHGFDGTARGIADAVKFANYIVWALNDVQSVPLEFDDDQRRRISQALIWVEEPSPFGVADPEIDPARANALREFDGNVRPLIVQARSRLLKRDGKD